MGYLIMGDDGPEHEQIVVEVSADDSGVIPVGIDPSAIARRAAVPFEESLTQVRRIADASIASLRHLTESPDEVKVEFGIKFVADIGAVLAKAGAEANLTVSVLWHPNRKDS
jgi:hypothetical protein